MNKDNAKDYLPLVQALAEGKTIQLKAFGQWIDLENPDFVYSLKHYRIKPEPKKEWVRVGLWRVGLDSRRYASSEEDEIRLQSLPHFGGWLTDRIEYELPEGEV